MKITFVTLRRNIYPRLGFCYLSSYLATHFPGRIRINLVELSEEENPARALKRSTVAKPEVIGFSTHTVSFHEVQTFDAADHICHIRTLTPREFMKALSRTIMSFRRTGSPQL